MPVFKNLKKFKAWYKENYKGNFKHLNWDAVLDEVVEAHRTTGDAYYEMCSFDSKSGNPEVYDYNIIYKYDEKSFETLEEALEEGEFETIFIF